MKRALRGEPWGEGNLTRAINGMVAQGRMAPGLSFETYCDRFHIAYGHPEEVTASLQADRVLPHATELILQLDPVFPSLDHTLRMFEQVATEVAPALGWRPRQQERGRAVPPAPETRGA